MNGNDARTRGTPISDQQGGDAHAGRGPEQTKQQCFGHELDDEPAATGTEGRANGHFLRSRHAAREQQVREIGTRDQQDEDDRDKRDVHRPAKIGTEKGIRQRIEGDRPAGVRFHCGVMSARLALTASISCRA